MQKPPLVFFMGRSPVFLPVDRVYTRGHYWASRTDGGYRIGFTGYAVRLLGDVHCLQWSVAEGGTVEQGCPIGYIEGSKATSDLYAPFAGRVEQIHGGVLADPSLVNSNLYDTGWLMVLSGDGDGLLSPEEYFAHLEACWPLAQRLLKGQAGQKPPSE